MACAALCLAVLSSCSSNCPIPHESAFVRHHLPMGFSFSYPNEWALEELHNAVWMRNYCKPAIWLNAAYYEIHDLDLISTETEFFQYVEEALSKTDGEGRFVPLENSSQLVNVESTICVRSVGKLEERSTQNPGEVIHHIDRGDLQCLHPTKEGWVIHLFYWVEDNRQPAVSPEQKIGE